MLKIPQGMFQAARVSAASLALATGRAGFRTSAVKAYKVCIIGGGGGIGQPMSMLLTLNPDVTEVRSRARVLLLKRAL